MLTGRPALLNRARYRELSAPGFVCSVAKIEAATGWRAAIAIDDGVQATADWYRRAGWL
jgi:nucleoside-diphosphate-sugar epimerase